MTILNKKILKAFIFILIFSLMPVIHIAGANSLSSVKINQLKQNGDTFKVYFEAADENDNRILNLHEKNVKISSESGEFEISEVVPFAMSEEKTAYIFLIDISSSVREKQLNNVCDAIAAWIDKMDNGNKAAIITFSEKINVVSDFTDDKENLKNLVSEIKISAGTTQLYGGLMRAAEMLGIADSSLPDRKAAIIFSDGINGTPSSYTKDEAVAAIKEASIPFYAAAFASTGANSEGALADLGSIMRQSGGDLFNIKDDNGISSVFNDIYKKISEVYVAKARIPGNIGGGDKKAITFSVEIEGRSIEKTADFKFAGTQSQGGQAEDKYEDSDSAVDVMNEVESRDETESHNESPSVNYVVFIAIFTIPVLILIFLVAFFLMKRQKKIKSEANIKEQPAVEPNLTPKKKTVGLNDNNVSNTPPQRKGGKTTPLFPEASFSMDIVEKNRDTGFEKSYSRLLRSNEILRIGRDFDNNIIIDDETVSGEQCMIKATSNGVLITNKSMTNRTLLNNREVSDAYEEMPYSSVIRIGKTDLTLQIKNI